MSKQKEKEMERAAKIAAHRQEAQDALVGWKAARIEVGRLSKEYNSICQANQARVIDYAGEGMEAWNQHHRENREREREGMEAWKKASDKADQIFAVYKRKTKVVKRDEVREAARIARAAERLAQKQQEPRAIKLREKKAAEFKKAMEIMRERLVDADDFYL
jgi:hypothetical protein